MKHLLQFSLLCLAAAVLVFLAAGVSAGADKKIPVTTSSKEALEHFLTGRALVDNLRLTDASAHFAKAVEKDPSFALAHLYVAQTAPTNKEFFANLDKALTLATNASDGEQLWIKGARAGAYADPESQRKLYQKLVDLYPGDERALTLLGISYFGQQQFENAAKYLKKAIDQNPGFAPAYNQLGYAYRFLNRYEEAERTFEKYTQLIPDDPNPYDSYAELLMRLGRFDESIAQYKKALSVNNQFANSFIGIAANLMYQGKHEEARTELKHAFAAARTDAERRVAIFATGVTYIDEGKLDAALQELERQYAIAEKNNDVGAMAGDLTAMGNILLELGRGDDALVRFEKSIDLIRNSGLAKEVKENAALVHNYNTARVSLAKKDYAAARADAERFMAGAEAKKNRIQVRLAHELAGSIALGQNDFQTAVKELEQASDQNPYNFYRLALAYQGAGRPEEARKRCTAAARFYVLPLQNFAFIRQKAERMLPAL